MAGRTLITFAQEGLEPITLEVSPHMMDKIYQKIERTNQRLHGLLLVAQGMSALEVARLLGDAPRTVQYWVRRFEHDGLAGLLESERPGRPRRLDERQMVEVNAALRSSPEECGLSGNLWDGKTLSEWIALRRYPEHRRKVAWVNYAAAVGTGAVALRNYKQ